MEGTPKLKQKVKINEREHLERDTWVYSGEREIDMFAIIQLSLNDEIVSLQHFVRKTKPAKKKFVNCWTE